MASSQPDDLPTVEEVLSGFSSSHWLKQALQSALNRDCVDAAHDAELLSKILNARADKILGVKHG